ncbi:MAG: hypothetical protein HDQ88_02955 [Clostridia bacterium]|nr:hypothetical protein [Clostridia bacterium]
MFDLIAIYFMAYWFWFIIGFVVLFFGFLCWRFRKVWLCIVGVVLVVLMLCCRPLIYGFANIYFDWSHCRVFTGTLVGTEDEGVSGRLVLCLDREYAFLENRVARVIPFDIDDVDDYSSGQSVVVLVKYHAVPAIGFLNLNPEDEWYHRFWNMDVVRCAVTGNVSEKSFLGSWDMVCSELSFVH